VNDLYQLTMGHGYSRHGLAATPSVFYLSFRGHPFGGGFTVAAGLEQAARHAAAFRFDEEDLDFLASLEGRDGARLFDAAYLRELGALEPACEIAAVPEGTVVFPGEPVLRVRGPLLQAQLLETPLLNLVGFQSLIATKASRVRIAAGDDPVLEFGLRRAQGFDGGLTAARAAHLGGCTATSNLMAGRRWGIPVRGTHAHSWVMAFDDELEAFRSYAESARGEIVLLVDTYDTARGLEHAIEIGGWLRARGSALDGVRLDSGELAALSRAARRRLDEAGLSDVRIVASGDLDEHEIQRLRAAGARIDVWGVGTRLVTGGGQGAMQAVYKLSALHSAGGWSPRSKRSDEPGKASLPGVLQVRRFQSGENFVGDGLYDEQICGEGGPRALVWPGEEPDAGSGTDLLQVLVEGTEIVGATPPLAELRLRVQDQLRRLPAGVRSLIPTERYALALDAELHGIVAARRGEQTA
jgi:nicotinate phosphoribosyltransferase